MPNNVPDYDSAYYAELLAIQDAAAFLDADDYEIFEVTREMCDPSEFFGYSEFSDEELEDLLPF